MSWRENCLNLACFKELAAEFPNDSAFLRSWIQPLTADVSGGAGGTPEICVVRFPVSLRKSPHAGGMLTWIS